MKITNPFHGTTIVVKSYRSLLDLQYAAFYEGDPKAKRTYARMAKKLCPSKGCACAGMWREQP